MPPAPHQGGPMARFLLHFSRNCGSTGQIAEYGFQMGKFAPLRRSGVPGETTVVPLNDVLFWGPLFQGLDRAGSFLQLQIRQMIVTAIEDGRLPLGVRMPSSRDLASLLKVSRNTIVIAYEQLVDQNFLVSRERSGYFVAGLPKQIGTPANGPAIAEIHSSRWTGRFALRPSRFRASHWSGTGLGRTGRR